MRNIHQISYERYAYGGLPFFLNFDLLNPKKFAQLMCGTRCSRQVIQF